MSDLYSRLGEPITSEEWGQLLQDREYKRVAWDMLPDGRLVSTVWLGLDHGFIQGHPLIFETMVFESATNFASLECRRYHTETEARQGHQDVVARWRNGTPTDDDQGDDTTPEK